MGLSIVDRLKERVVATGGEAVGIQTIADGVKRLSDQTRTADSVTRADNVVTIPAGYYGNDVTVTIPAYSGSVTTG